MDRVNLEKYTTRQPPIADLFGGLVLVSFMEDPDPQKMIARDWSAFGIMLEPAEPADPAYSYQPVFYPWHRIEEIRKAKD